MGSTGLEDAGKGLMVFGEKALKAAQKQQAMYDFTKTSEAYDSFRGDTMAEYRRRQLEDDPSRPDFETDFGRYVDERSASILGSLPETVSQEAMDRLNIKLREQSTSLRDSAGILSIESLKARAKDAFDGRLSGLSAQARQAPEFLDTLIEEGNDVVSEMAPGMTPDMERDNRLNVRKSLAQAAIEGEIGRRKFTEAKAVLNDEKFKDVFDATTRGVLTNRILDAEEGDQRRQLAAAEKKERDAEKAQKRIEEDAAKEGEDLLANDKLTPDWIEANRDRLGRTDYRYLYGKVNGEDSGVTNPDVYSDLRERAGRGEDVRAEARSAYVDDKNLKREDYDRLFQMSEQGSVEGELPSWFKRGDSYIKNALAVGEAVDDPFGRLRQAEAMDEWWAWARNHKTANDTEAETAYRRITGERALVNFSNSVAVMPLPRFLAAGSQRTDIGIESLDAAEAALFAAFNAREISPEDYRRQIVLSEQWRQAIENRDKAAKK
jgi:hypothetical protein